MKATYPGICAVCRHPIKVDDEIVRTELTIVGSEVAYGHHWSGSRPYYKTATSRRAHLACAPPPEPAPEPVNEVCPLCKRSHVVGDEIAMWCEDVEANDDNLESDAREPM